MKTGKTSVYFPVDHRANLSGYQTEAVEADLDARPWPVRRHVGVYLVLALAAWIVVLSPFVLID